MSFNTTTGVGKKIDKRQKRSASTRLTVALNKLLALSDSTGAHLTFALKLPDGSFVTLSTGDKDWKQVADDLHEFIESDESVGFHFTEKDTELITAKSRHRYKDLDDEVNKMHGGPKILWNAFPGSEELKKRLLPQLRSRHESTKKDFFAVKTVDVDLSPQPAEPSPSPPPYAQLKEEVPSSVFQHRKVLHSDGLEEVPMGILKELFP